MSLLYRMFQSIYNFVVGKEDTYIDIESNLEIPQDIIVENTKTVVKEAPLEPDPNQLIQKIYLRPKIACHQN